MGGNCMAQSPNKTMANPDSTGPVSDGMGWGGGSNCGSATNPGRGDSNTSKPSSEDLGSSRGGGHQG